jgi:hypothetical protein
MAVKIRRRLMRPLDLAGNLIFGTDKFYLSLLWSLAMMHVIDAVLDSFLQSISIPQVLS